MVDVDDARRQRFFRLAIPEGLREEVAQAAAGGRYELREKIGEGGMAVVHRGFDRELGREVAIKVLKEPAYSSAVGRERFEREAKAGARLSHPNLVVVHDVVELGGRPALVMELVRGEPLGHVLARRTSERRPLLSILEKVARAVGHAHEAGVVHRDLKPGNVLMTPEGEPKVADFGLAMLAEAVAITQTGAAIGTPPYMAPEQARDGGATTRTDIYALGAMLYEILTGRPPHTGDRVAEVIARVLHDEPVPPRRLNPDVPADLEAVCLKAIEKEPDRRYATAAGFADDLRRHLAGEPVSASSAHLRRWVRRHRTASGVTAASVAVVLAAGAWWAWERAEIAALSKRAEAAGPAESAELYAELKRRDARFGEKAVEARLRAEAAVRRAKAERSLGEARRARDEFELQRTGLSGLEAGSLEADRLRVRMADRRAAMLAAYARSAAEDPTFAEPRRFLARFYRDELVAAEQAGDAGREAELRQYVALYDDGSVARELEAPGSVAIRSEPEGARVDLFRWIETDDGRLEAEPIDVRPPAPLPRGSYLAVLRLDGFRDVRYPFFVERGAALEARVRMRTDAEIGSAYVYVPGGAFIAGGDPGAYESAPRAVAEAGDVYISKSEVTVDEYHEFIADLIAKGREAEAVKRIPHHGNRYFWRFDAAAKRIEIPVTCPRRSPVFCVSADDADAYCAWRSAKEGRKLRLPTSAEWERAARGADGRRFPWGPRFEWSFTSGRESRAAGAVWPAEVGAFPKDVSPFGVLDLGGNVREWCSDVHDPALKQRYVRGGSWAGAGESFFRCATRFWFVSYYTDGGVGFRVAAEP